MAEQKQRSIIKKLSSYSEVYNDKACKNVVAAIEGLTEKLKKAATSSSEESSNIKNHTAQSEQQ